MLERVKNRYTERGLRKRRCHICRCSIPTTEKHFAVYGHSRTNVCMFCLEVTVKYLKKNSTVPIKQRRAERQVEQVLEQL